MAILHRADLTPTKPELVAALLDARQGTVGAPVQVVGSYRFDDPEGEVGVEGLIVTREGRTFHVPLTYRGAPLPGAEGSLVGRMQHSVLGERWVYRAAADPVACACLVRALRGEQAQSELEVWSGDTLVGRPKPSVTVAAEDGSPTDGGGEGEAVQVGSQVLRIAEVLDGGPGPNGARLLLASWSDTEGTHRAVIASLADGH